MPECGNAWGTTFGNVADGGQKAEMRAQDNDNLMCFPINIILSKLNLLAFTEEDKDG